MDEAAIDQFLDQLTDAGPFHDATTAVAARTGPLLRAADSGRFEHWLMMALAAAAVQCPHRDDVMTGIAVLQGDRLCHSFDQGANEAGGTFLRRLMRASNKVAEPWLLVGLRDRAGELWWYAEARGRGCAQARVGRLGTNGDANAFTGEPIHPSDAHSLGKILHGHPARRRFPLRRS